MDNDDGSDPEEDADEDDDDDDDEEVAKIDLGIEEDDDQGLDGGVGGAVSDWPPPSKGEEGENGNGDPRRAKKPSLDLIQGQNSRRLIQLFEQGTK